MTLTKAGCGECKRNANSESLGRRVASAISEMLGHRWGHFRVLLLSELIFTSPVDNTGAPASDRKKGNKAIERTVLSSFQIAQSLRFNGDYRAWENLLRSHD